MSAGGAAIGAGLPGDPAAVDSAPDFSVIIPTYREVLNIGPLVERLEAERARHGWRMEVLFMDDASGDGSEEAVAALGKPWVRMVVRRSNRGLSAAVLEGLGLARGRRVVVMDADLSHPPERIADLLAALDAGAEMAVGSRRVPGGSTDREWGWMRRLNSGVATALARPLTNLRDPMSGFFALRRESLARAGRLNPVGYKIGLEILVKCGCRDVREVPIHFADRRHGASKLTAREQWRYVRHLRRLYLYRFPVLWRGVEAVGVGLFVLAATGVVYLALR